MSFLFDIDFMPTCVSVFKKENANFILIDANKRAKKLDKLILGQNLTQIYPNAKEIGLLEVMIKVEKSGKNEIFENQYSTHQKEPTCRHNEIVKLPNGHVALFYADNNSFKKLTNPEELLQKKKNMFQEVMKSSTAIAVQGYDVNHKVIYWNKASENIYGYTQKEALGKNLEDLIIPIEMQSIVSQLVEDWHNKNIPIPSSEMTLIDKYGNDVHVYSQHEMIQVGLNEKEMYCIDIDLNKTKKLQDELIAQRDFLKTIFDIIPDLVWVKDVEGKYISCNRKFEQFFGAKECEIIGKTDFDFVDTELATFFRKNDKLAIKNDKPTINEEYLEFADGSQKGDFETIKIPIKNTQNICTSVMGIAHDISLHKIYQQQLLHFANTDRLTGLSNRVVFADRLDQLLKHRDSKNRYYAVLFIDLDDFKEVNDTKGHNIGDNLLIEVSKKLKKVVRKGDTVARFGGDEFLLLLEQINSPQDAAIVAQKTLDSLKEPIYIEKYELFVSVSIGISVFPSDGVSTEILLCNADSAMYYAKKHGKNNYKFFDEIKGRP